MVDTRGGKKQQPPRLRHSGHMAQSFRCTDCGAMLMNHAEMQAHAEDLGHQGFEEATDVISIKYCCECGKDCRNETAQQMHTRNTGHATYQDTRPARKVATPAAATADGEGGGGAAPMDVDRDEGTVGAQALGMLPGIEALDEAGDREGQTKMVRILDDSGNAVAAVFKWAAKEKKWNKHKEVVDEDQPASAEEIEKALAVVNAELLGAPFQPHCSSPFRPLCHFLWLNIRARQGR